MNLRQPSHVYLCLLTMKNEANWMTSTDSQHHVLNGMSWTDEKINIPLTWSFKRSTTENRELQTNPNKEKRLKARFVRGVE